jgi:succinate-acetate transporter protein
MAKSAIALGVLLILLGILGFVSAGTHAASTLLPVLFGFLISIFGLLALTDNAKKRMLFMHIAVTIGLIGFFANFWSIVEYIQMRRGLQFPHPVIVEERAAAAAVLLFFVLLCVRSFIAARRTRTQERI